ncbi:putative serine protease F56F10.1 [Leptinotarsa decemlineata]|uniref:putative serine protease F56F10.1 n=1 Tax=Leptinotarsa decemlineata TaxID=7539 RepID=UPI000C253CAD|nr:putative serine protease F56F10.1 [Leptinotarsa decemlineata]XP_023014736.1 putative serine protease F56F10.1 [Leptinotarsa decemlineata]
MTKLFVLISIAVLLCIVETGHCWRFFYNGRVVDKDYQNTKSWNLQSSPSKYERWFTQKLDHFNPNDERTWKQRYYVNDEFVNKQRNIAFLMIGGEGEASADWMESGAWIDYAKEFKPICFQLEHRYYGKSHPTEDLRTKNLKFLSSQQALVDVAYFIENMNIQYELSPDVKWIAFGGSYPGSLAAWLRQKYPHLVHGAMSASGPLLAELNFDQYFKVVEDDLRLYSDDCLNAVQEGTIQVNTLLKHKLGQRNLDTLFKLCDPIGRNVENSLDISNFFSTLAGNFAGIAQYNKDNRKSNRQHNVTLDVLCNIMVNQSIGPQITRLSAVNNLILSITNQECLDYKYDKMISELRNISWDSITSEGGRQWTYQTCTEFGFYQTSDYKPQIFGDKFPLDFSVQQCTDIFGPRYNLTFLQDAVERTNIMYGALNIDVTNVVFVHGSVDPWHALGITKTLENRAPAIYIEGGAHCSNMYPKSENDTPQLRAARVQIQQLIGSWLDL